MYICVCVFLQNEVDEADRSKEFLDLNVRDRVDGIHEMNVVSAWRVGAFARGVGRVRGYALRQTPSSKPNTRYPT